ncbi:MAG: putative outer rane efflux protein [Pseudomonadota bacterium]
MQYPPPRSRAMTVSAPRRLIALAAAAVLTGCASVTPVPLAPDTTHDANRADAVALRADVPPIAGPLTLDEALARALKYNLDRRVRMLEEAIAHQQLDLSVYDMLPRIAGQTALTSRSNDRISESRDALTGAPSTARFISQDRTHTTMQLGLSWSLLDFGLGYYNSQQQGDRVQIALEKRRKAMHLLAQDVRIAFWRAASAQALQDRVRATVAMAQDALVDARQAEASRVRNPADSLRYQRQVLENLRLLEAIAQELSAAQVELAWLINAPLGQSLRVVEPPEDRTNRHVLQLPIEQLEETALRQSADLREQHHNTRIARLEARKTLVKLFPNISFSYSLNYDTDNYLVNNRWNEAGLQLSFNLMNLVTMEQQKKLAEAGIKLADQRRLTAHMAVLAQVHLARLQWDNALRQMERNEEIYAADRRLAELLTHRESVQTQSKLDRVSAETGAILSLLRHYQSISQAHAAEARLEASLGLDPVIASVDSLSLPDLVGQLRTSRRWALGPVPAPVAPRGD